jgi:hypothetical protein
VTDQRIVCRDDETTCRAPVRGVAAWYHFTFDPTKKTGSLVFCSDSGCLEPSPLTVVRDYCASVGRENCLRVNIYVWEPTMQQTYTISDSRYVMTQGLIASVASHSITEFGRCAVH